MKRILVIEDQADIRENILELLELEGFEAIAAEDGVRGVELAEQASPDLVLCDITMPRADGYTVLETLREDRRTAFIPFIFLSAKAAAADQRKGMALGADDYLTKPYENADLLSAIRARLRRVEDVSRPKQPVDAELHVSAVVLTPAHREVYRRALQAAKSAASILLLGETGVGKDVLARAIHEASPRAAGPFEARNCGAFPETLVESELFGHRKGSFTGAIEDKKGLFELAHGGTVFLDEIGELPPSIQVKLLRVLEDRTVLPVGGRTPHPVDVRLVSATNVDLASSKAFREDLRYRINAVTLRIPPLRERREEIVPLAERFLRVAAGLQGSAVPDLTPEVREALLSYAWPGNVRELRNAMESAVLFCQAGEVHVGDLPPELGGESPISGVVLSAEERLERQRKELERQRIVDALEQCGGNQTKAAALLDISRRTLVTRLNEHDIPRPRKR